MKDSKKEKEKVKKNTRKSNGEGSIYQRSDGRWCAAIQVGTNENGKPIIKYLYGKTRKEVVAKLDQYKLLSSTNPEVVAKSLTVDVYILSWLKNVQFNKLKATSYDRIECTIKNHIIPNIGFIYLNELTSAQIQELVINKMLKKNLSYSSIKKAYNALNACLKYAIKTKALKENPALNVSLPSVHKFDKNDIRFLTDEEIKKFKDTCVSQYKNDKYIYPLGYGMIFILNTGIRLGEALALKWKDIDFDKKIMTIDKNLVMAVDRKFADSEEVKRTLIEQDTTKTQSGERVIPLNNNAINALENLKQIRYFGNNRYIFSTKENKPNKPRNFCRTYESILKAADIDHCGIHTLRHTFASKLFEKGVDVKTVSEILGHSDVSITYNTYIHLLKKQKAAAVTLLDI